MSDLLRPSERAAVDVLDALIGSCGADTYGQIVCCTLKQGRNAILEKTLYRSKIELLADSVEALEQELDEAKAGLWEPCPRCGHRKEAET